SKMLPYGGHLHDQALEPLGGGVAAAVGKGRTNGRRTLTGAAAGGGGNVLPALAARGPRVLGATLGRGGRPGIWLGVIYAALDNKTQIDIPHLEAALAVWDYCEQSATQIFGDLVGDDVADTILQALRVASPNGITRTEISALFSRHVSSSRLSLSLALLRRLG